MKVKNLWLKIDNRFLIPNTKISIIFHSPDIYKNIDNYVNLLIIKNLALHYLEKELYPALIVGFNYQIKLSNENLVLILDGLNDKFINFISLSLDVFFNFKKKKINLILLKMS